MSQRTGSGVYSTQEGFRNSALEYEFEPQNSDLISYTTGSSTFDTFNQFALKVVLLSNDTTRVPVVYDMRAIALPEGLIKMQINITNSTLARDMNSRSLIETDLNKATEYKTKARIMNDTRDLKEQMCALRQKVENLETVKQDINEIKELIKGLIR
jgi:hypothetical protein